MRSERSERPQPVVGQLVGLATLGYRELHVSEAVEHAVGGVVARVLGFMTALVDVHEGFLAVGPDLDRLPEVIDHRLVAALGAERAGPQYLDDDRIRDAKRIVIDIDIGLHRESLGHGDHLGLRRWRRRDGLWRQAEQETEGEETHDRLLGFIADTSS